MGYVTRSGRRILRGLVPAGALCVAGPAVAQEAIPVNLRRVSERVLVTWSCDRFQGTNMAVLATDSGLVLIDTGLSGSMVRRQRARIEAELGRDDFRFLINTHMHNDHAFANEVFPEATVVGPAGSVAALEREVSRIPDLLGRLRESRSSWSDWAAETRPDSAEGLLAREGVAAVWESPTSREGSIRARRRTRSRRGAARMSAACDWSCSSSRGCTRTPTS